MATARIEGIDALIRKLRAAPRATRRLLAERVIEPTATDVEVRAKSVVPKREGDLLAAITQTGRGLRRNVGIEGGAAGGRTGSSSHVDPSIYGVMVEYGTSRQGAQPFMRPGAEYGGSKLEGRTRQVARELESEVARA